MLRDGVRSVVLVLVATVTAACACVSSAPPFPVTTAPFLGPTDFSGTYNPKSGTTDTGGQAIYRGHIVFTNLDRTLVQGILPSGLKLASTSSTAGLHPIIYLYGHPEQTSWIVAGTSLMNGENYEELMLLVPFVQESSGTKWHTYVVRMYLNNEIAIEIGNLFFAYGKERGSFDIVPVADAADPNAFAVTALDSGATAKFRGTIRQKGVWRSSGQAEGDIPNYQVIQSILAMPVVGRRPNGDLVCSYFELGYTNATVAPAESVHQFLDPFVSGMAAWLGLGSMSSVVNGAVAVRDLDWRIAQPPAPPCSF